MLLPAVDYYAIVDASGQEKSFKVVGEYDDKREAELARDKLSVCGCEVYAEVGGKLYRVICERMNMISTPSSKLE
jgi:hypothetical protein